MSVPRLFVDVVLQAQATLALPEAAARHAQVLRLQPGDVLTLFDGRGGEWSATVQRMGRREVEVQVMQHHDVDRELPLAVTLAVGMPANERFDWLVEKATELGAAAIEPLVCARSVLRVDGERGERKRAHWQAIAVAAAEQCGRTRVPRIAPVQTFAQWCESFEQRGGAALWLLRARDATSRAQMPAPTGALHGLSGPEGGLTSDEEATALALGARAVSLGPRVLRAETAPLALLATLNDDHAAP